MPVREPGVCCVSPGKNVDISMLAYEQTRWNANESVLAGVDEAGRGPLAGPVVAAAVVLQSDFALREYDGLLRGLTDSKKLTAASRERFYHVLRNAPEVQIGVGVAIRDEIDALNILRATHIAMARALDALPESPTFALVDGLPVKGLPCDSLAIVKGDGLSLSIAAASVVAKVVRDDCMRDFARQYPQYGFEVHKGYGTAAHLRALAEHGPSPIHRFSFKPVQTAYAQRQLPLN